MLRLNIEIILTSSKELLSAATVLKNSILDVSFNNIINDKYRNKTSYEK